MSVARTRPTGAGAGPTVRQATGADAAAMERVEAAAHELLAAHGVDLGTIQVPEGVDAPASWTVAFVAEVHGEVVGTARLTELTPELICLDQVSVHPDFAGQGVGRLLLTEVASRARALGYAGITGTTFRDVPFNSPFYAGLGCVEARDPHPVMLRRRRVEQACGLDRLGPRVVLRLPL